ncbi:MAG: ABC transporter substrate-binding protein [Oscillospiraceae bacterium]|jgi:NitT/TauT family transport system substrate-binding protein
MKKILTVILAIALIASFSSCAGGRSDMNVGALIGPTGVGMAKLMDEAESGNAKNDYSFTLATEPTELAGKLVSGELDVAALPTNLAASLYNKTEGGIRLLALNTLGVLYIAENGDTVHSVADLRGRTIAATGQGANPEYVLNYILEQNGLTPGQDVTIEFYSANDELSAKLIGGEVELAMLPVPALTAVLMKSEDVRVALDLTEEWDAVTDEGVLTMGCIAVRTEYLKENEKAVKSFLEEYEASVSYALTETDEAAKLVAEFGVTASAEIARAAIPDCNLVCITGSELRSSVEPYYKVLFDADPSSIGGALPGDDFYYGG